MVLNVRPDYLKAEQQYKAARTPEEQLAALRRMLATAPKHKSAEKLLRDLRRRIAALRREVESGRRKAGRTADPFHIPAQGAGQVLLLGAPNTGKSTLVAALTDAPVRIAEYPFSTQTPVPGMAYHEDVPIQLIDTPPITADHVPPGLLGALHEADALLIVVNIALPSVLEDFEVPLRLLEQRRLAPVFDPEPSSEEGSEVMPIRTLVACTGCDLPGATQQYEALRDLYGDRFAWQPVSGKTGEGLSALTARLFELLNVIRVYAKPPGKPPDLKRPFILPRHATVEDLAEMIHKDLADNFRFARIWGERVYSGTQVHREHELFDRDIVEIHA